MALISDTKVDENNKKEPQEDIELGSFKKEDSFFIYIKWGYDDYSRR